jgi:hypothetical protein
MSEAYLTNWSFGGENPDTRNRFHEIALSEARVATEYRARQTPTPARESLLGRLQARVRFAFTGPASVDGCNCPA